MTDWPTHKKSCAAPAASPAAPAASSDAGGEDDEFRAAISALSSLGRGRSSVEVPAADAEETGYDELLAGASHAAAAPATAEERTEDTAAVEGRAPEKKSQLDPIGLLNHCYMKLACFSCLGFLSSPETEKLVYPETAYRRSSSTLVDTPAGDLARPSTAHTVREMTIASDSEGSDTEGADMLPGILPRGVF